MTNEEVQHIAQSIIDGKKKIRLDNFWHYKDEYIKNKGVMTRALIRQKDRCRIAMPHLTASPIECDEYRDALLIIKEVERIKNE